MITQARVVGWRARLSLVSSTTTLAPNTGVQRRGDGLAGALAGGGDGALVDRFGVGGGHAQAVASEGLA